MNSNICVLSGTSHHKLSSQISKELGCDLCRCNITDFSNTEIKINIEENIRNKDIFIIETGTYGYYDSKSVNDYLMETFILIDACRRSNVNSINLIMPCYPYARQDKKEDSREPITAKLVATLLTSAGINRLLVLDLHSPQIQGFFDIPVDNLYSIPLVMEYLNNTLFKGLTYNDIINTFIVVSPDAGATKRTLKFAQAFRLNTLIMHKQRNYSKVNTIDSSMIIGDSQLLNNKTAIIMDDMCDTAGTLVQACDTLTKEGAKDVIAIITHGIFSGEAIKRINECNSLKKIIVSDSIPQDFNTSVSDKIEVFSIDKLLSEAIKKLMTGESLGDLFKI